MTRVTVTALHFEPRGFVPNNFRLPALIYEKAFDPAAIGDLATFMEKRFQDNGWPPQWRDGIYDFEHYHAQGHEVLGIAAGSAELVLGGDGGREIRVEAGDILVLPAGTGHRRLKQSEDFLVVGAYPPGQAGDIVREEASPAMKQRIALLSFPPKDPVLGDEGPMLRLWANTSIT
ncbi:MULTISPECIES: cupin domain-containing protein [Bosea]|uniref:Uncharacterized protein YjlB n=1 Tax=Bosea robiniae TaxID=1036780 RepID=A0ABY0P555_9HYPH|nr:MULTISPECIES: cupin domain-containing protein [Bosea]TQI72399.1 uncharacterized protein YjlB [Bosea sp. AK1]SDH31599.1 Uncharacterized protein YjlB [Bosea robiniae]